MENDGKIRLNIRDCLKINVVRTSMHAYKTINHLQSTNYKTTSWKLAELFLNIVTASIKLSEHNNNSDIAFKSIKEIRRK